MIIAVSIYAVQIAIGALTQFVEAPYIDNFSKWVIYILPLFRLGDFAIGCCFGNIFLKRDLTLNESTATIFEIVIIPALICSQIIFRRGITFPFPFTYLGSEWFRHTMLYTPTSVAIILLFAIKQGRISKALTCKPIIYIGNISAYTFLIHQMVIRYVGTFSYRFLGYELNRFVKLIIALGLSILCAEIYRTIERKFNKDKL